MVADPFDEFLLTPFDYAREFEREHFFGRFVREDNEEE